jgi:hypothetical protein
VQGKGPTEEEPAATEHPFTSRSEDTYLQSLRRAQADLIIAIRERDELNVKILRLQQLVKALKSAADVDLGFNEKLEAFEKSADTTGFTDAVLTIPRGSRDELTARNIRDHMVELGYELGKYANPLGFIHYRAWPIGSAREDSAVRSGYVCFQ